MPPRRRILPAAAALLVAIITASTTLHPASAHLTDAIIRQKELAWVQGAVKHVQYGFDEEHPLKHYEYLDFENISDMDDDASSQDMTEEQDTSQRHDQGSLRGSFSA